MRERISNKMMEKENCNVVDIFGENVFNDSVMQARLPKKVYKKLHEVMEEGKELDLETADVVAHEMKEWAICCSSVKVSMISFISLVVSFWSITISG